MASNRAAAATATLVATDFIRISFFSEWFGVPKRGWVSSSSSAFGLATFNNSIINQAGALKFLSPDLYCSNPREMIRASSGATAQVDDTARQTKKTKQKKANQKKQNQKK